MKFFFSRKIFALKVVVLLLFTNNSNSQTTYKVIYKVEPILQEKIDDKSESTKQIVKKIVEYARNANYVLIANQKNSIFKKEEQLQIGNKDRLEHIYIKGSKLFTSFNEKIYTDFENYSIIFIRNLLDRNFTVKRSFHEFNWKINDSVKTILGLKARNAKGAYYDPISDKKIEVDVWFTPSIPLSAGPDIFMGLPGLIVEIHLKKAIISVSTIEENIETDIKSLKSNNVLTQEEFENMILKLNSKILKDFN